MKHTKKIIAAMLAVLMIAMMIPTFAAAEDGTEKEEVVYISLNGDGSVKEINVVNIFDLDADGKIIDYGKYESLRNMTTTDKIGYANEKITIDAKAGRLYYEGKLSSNVMPWNISIRYYMDGTEYTAQEIAGKSGDLKITMQITENEPCVGDFFEGFALQASVSLDTKKCSDIRASGATVANVGSKKQLTYTILPGKGADIEITASVKDFEMDGIAINGIRLKLNIEIDDTTIQNKIDEILSAVGTLDDAADKINNGASDLYDGTTELKDKVGQLPDGVGALAAGSANLAGGLSAIVSQNEALLGGAWAAFEGLCAASETILNAQLVQNGFAPVDLTPENYASVLEDVLALMDADQVYNLAYAQALAEVTAQVEANQDALYMGYVESIADSIYLAYMHSQADMLYAQVAAQLVMEQLIAQGFTADQAAAYLQTAEGQALIAQTVAQMTEEQKEQIIMAALAALTDDQKAQILAGAVATLTDDQKVQIREGYIDQMMKSEEVTSQITAAVAAASAAAANVAMLKGQLDNYVVFYEGLKSYTEAVSAAATGAQELKINMDALNAAVGTLNTSVGQLHDGVKELFDGTTELKNGTGEFVDRTADSDEMISNMIDSVISSVAGADFELTSFVSDKNTNVESVQFVIKTEAIAEDVPLVEAPVVEEKLNFWQKLLRLFGLY